MYCTGVGARDNDINFVNIDAATVAASQKILDITKHAGKGNTTLIDSDSDSDDVKEVISPVILASSHPFVFVFVSSTFYRAFDSIRRYREIRTVSLYGIFAAQLWR